MSTARSAGFERATLERISSPATQEQIKNKAWSARTVTTSITVTRMTMSAVNDEDLTLCRTLVMAKAYTT